MRLAKFTPGLLKRAVSVYMDHAYLDRPPRASLQEVNYDVRRFDELFAQFLDESKEEGGRRLARYALRLGNQEYPFMKLVLQEFVQPGDFYFAVDTHDEMRISPDVPGYDEFLEVRAFNRNLKCTIELAWTDGGLPTLYNLKLELEGAVGTSARAGARRARVLVVDDDEALAGVMEAILRKHGYEVVTAHDGTRALEVIEGASFDLVICDYQMPRMDGADLCEALRAREETRKIPVLLATAAAMSLSEITDKANGFLVKPYREDVLIGLIHTLLGTEEDDGAEPGPSVRS